MVNGRKLRAWIAVTLLVAACGTASSVPYRFAASLNDGPLSGTTFVGSFSYDAGASTGEGQEFLPLISLDFDLLGTHFSLNDIRQGGQAVLQNGQLSFFTAAFFPPPPSGSPVTDIAIGFGGPGVIGYVVGSDFDRGFGRGTVNVMSAIPEPGTAVLVLAGMVVTASLGVRVCSREERNASRVVHTGRRTPGRVRKTRRPTTQPTLTHIDVDGTPRDVVVQATKQGLVFVLDRETGRPVFPVEERAVPQGGVPGEVLSPTQTFPTDMPVLAPSQLRPDDAFGLTPWNRAACP
jgi:hypothetical protein